MSALKMSTDELWTMQNIMLLKSFRDVAEVNVGLFRNIPRRFRMTVEQDRRDTMAKKTTCHKIIIGATAIMEITMVIVEIVAKKRETWHICSRRDVEGDAVTICVWQFSFHYILAPLPPSTPLQCALLALLCTTSGTTCANF